MHCSVFVEYESWMEFAFLDVLLSRLRFYLKAIFQLPHTVVAIAVLQDKRRHGAVFNSLVTHKTARSAPVIPASRFVNAVSAYEARVAPVYRKAVRLGLEATLQLRLALGAIPQDLEEPCQILSRLTGVRVADLFTILLINFLELLHRVV